MKAAMLIVLLATGCEAIIGIPERSLPEVSVCSGTINIKILYDATGGTSDVGIPFFKGQQDLIREINQGGGIRGCTIQYDAMDYGYVPATAQAIYETWKAEATWPDVAAILGWGSSDSLLLAPRVRDDQKPLLSASYIGGLAAPIPVVRDESIPELSPSTFGEISFPQHFTSDGFPYNFFAGTDYSTGARIAMFEVKALGGKRVGFFYCSAAYCRDPIPAARQYAKEQGLLLGRDLTLELTDTQATFNSKVLAYFMQEKAQAMADSTYKIVDWVWGGNTTKTTAYMAKAIDAMNQTLGLSVQLIVNNWGFDENLFPLCGAACVERVHGIMPFVAYGDGRAVETAKVMALHDKWRMVDASREGNATYKNVRYVQGYVNVLLLKLAAEAVIDQGKPVNGINLKEALESFEGVDTGGLTGRLTFTPTDHRPQSTESIYKFDAAGKLVLEAQRTITMQQSWLGW
jgi:ABC-type branched-subunit amino acid transport system substrate-binding protein